MEDGFKRALWRLRLILIAAGLFCLVMAFAPWHQKDPTPQRVSLGQLEGHSRYITLVDYHALRKWQVVVQIPRMSVMNTYCPAVPPQSGEEGSAQLISTTTVWVLTTEANNGSTPPPPTDDRPLTGVLRPLTPFEKNALQNALKARGASLDAERSLALLVGRRPDENSMVPWLLASFMLITVGIGRRYPRAE